MDLSEDVHQSYELINSVPREHDADGILKIKHHISIMCHSHE